MKDRYVFFVIYMHNNNVKTDITNNKKTHMLNIRFTVSFLSCGDLNKSMNVFVGFTSVSSFCSGCWNEHDVIEYILIWKTTVLDNIFDKKNNNIRQHKSTPTQQIPDRKKNRGMCRRWTRTHVLLRARQTPKPLGHQLPLMYRSETDVHMDKVGRSWGTLQNYNTVCPRQKETQVQVQNSWTRFTGFWKLST